MNSSDEKVEYVTPAVIDHGSIADHTFTRRICSRARRPGVRKLLGCGPVAPGLSSTF